MPSAPLANASPDRINIATPPKQGRGKKRRRTRVGEKNNVGSSPDDNNSLGQGAYPGNGEDAPQEASPDAELLPHTPAVQIPFEDLIANTEDVFNCPPPAATPVDHVVWHHGPTSSDVSASMGSAQNGRKRARSSSPPASQADKTSDRKDSMDMNNMTRSLRTPNTDPAQELWNRYLATSAAGHGDAPLPSFSHLPPSSPQTPTTASKDSALRRTVSCGVEWPTSKPKRRRVEAEDSYSRTKDIFAASRRQILAPELPKTSRVSLLVERIQESLNRRACVNYGPSSSSPLPGRHAQPFSSQASPAPSPLKERRVQFDVLDQAPAANPPSASAPISNDSFSEFEDIDLDLDFFETVEKNLPQNLARPEPLPPPVPDTGQVPSCQPDTNPSPSPSKKSSFDEFGDNDEEDIFTTELQDLAAKVDSQSQCVPMAPAIKVFDGPSELEPIAEDTEQLDVVFDDDYDDDEIWDEVAKNIAGPVAGSRSASQIAKVKAIKRYLVLDLFETEYEAGRGKRRPQKMLSLKDEKTGSRLTVLLRQSWFDTRCTKGSYVHIIGDFHRGECIIDDANNMIILHPDHLISATVVGDSFTCTRRAALQDRVKATSRPTPPQVYGHIIHEMFGEALRLNQWTRHGFVQIIQRLLPNYLESLYEIQVSESDAVEYLLSKTPDLIGWASVFVSDRLSDAAIRDRNGALVPTAINKVLELEEHVWSPMYGLKGNIDATVQAEMQLPADSHSRTLVVPLELKTGKKDNVETHRAQTALYTLLLSDRYDVNVTSGILYYLETSRTFRVESIRNEIRHMIIERNELACYVHDKLDLPPMLQKPHMCKSCYSKSECFTYHKLVDGGDGETSGLGETFNEMVAHLQPSHASFFKKWDDLLTTEERDTMKIRRELWTMLSTERQQVGRCFANVIIQPGSAQENPESPKINRFQYTFIKHRAEPGFSFTESQITIGEPIVVSDEDGHFNLAAGYVLQVRPTAVVVAVDRRLQNAHRKLRNFDPESNQLFTGLADSKPDGTLLCPHAAGDDSSQPPKQYRIDKDEFANGMSTARNNLLRIMEKDLSRARELRQLIVDGVAPQFRSNIAAAYTLSGPASQRNLNIDQERAIEKVLCARDYALVLGMPGTGKTTTIAHIIRALVSQNKSVLLASYTHTAVDNILLKIKDDKIPTLRIGAVSKVHRDVQSFAELAGAPKKTTQELHKAWQDSKVVATTCLGINHGLFNARTFDYCIVDEASQITLPVCLGPIRHARTFILVGDHYQLPPLVQNKEAQAGGLNVSLFKLLSDAHPESVVNLEHQYRMAEDIQILSSTLVYGGRLKCGTDSVATRVLSIPNPELESKLCAQLATALIRAGVPPSSIGIVTFYRSQLSLIKHDIRAHAGTTAASELEIHTADKYQGRDKEVILLSCVRSNPTAQVGELLRDWRRVNVALTRARSKMVIIASASTLAASDVPVLKGLVDIMRQRAWILDLKPHALDSHRFAVVAPTAANPTPVGTSNSNDGKSASQAELSGSSSQNQPKPLQERSPNPVTSSSSKPTSGLPAFKKPQPKKVANGKAMHAMQILENVGIS
ncbi:hypothetical protein DV738_g2822, partial [Chaetothyriales sp. CBS 135597]